MKGVLLLKNIEKPFLKLWCGHGIFLLVVKIITFTLTFYFIERTHSIAYFSYLALAGTLPNLILLPLISSRIDQFDMKKTLIINSAVIVVAGLELINIISAPILNIGLLCAVFAVASLSTSIQTIIFDKAITHLTNKSNYHKA